MEETIKEKKDLPTFAFAAKLKIDFWLQALRTDISDEDLFDRLSNYWSVVGSMSGLIAGFTYIASSSGGIEFTQNDGFLGENRIHIFGLLSMTSFIITISSAISRPLCMEWSMLWGSRMQNGFQRIIGG